MLAAHNSTKSLLFAAIILLTTVVVHCLDTLRQAVMCHGDTAPITMRWGETQPVPLADSSNPHECVNWDTIEAWAEKRSVDAHKPGLVVHPTLGKFTVENSVLCTAKMTSLRRCRVRKRKSFGGCCRLVAFSQRSGFKMEKYTSGEFTHWSVMKEIGSEQVVYILRY